MSESPVGLSVATPESKFFLFLGKLAPAFPPTDRRSLSLACSLAYERSRGANGESARKRPFGRNSLVRRPSWRCARRPPPSSPRRRKKPKKKTNPPFFPSSRGCSEAVVARTEEEQSVSRQRNIIPEGRRRSQIPHRSHNSVGRSVPAKECNSNNKGVLPCNDCLVQRKPTPKTPSVGEREARELVPKASNAHCWRKRSGRPY